MRSSDSRHAGNVTTSRDRTQDNMTIPFGFRHSRVMFLCSRFFLFAPCNVCFCCFVCLGYTMIASWCDVFGVIRCFSFLPLEVVSFQDKTNALSLVVHSYSFDFIRYVFFSLS